MTKNYLFSKHAFLFSMGLLVMLASCQRESLVNNEGQSSVNGEIRFSVVAEPVTHDTKTVYGSRGESSQPIYWQSGDKITVYSPNAATSTSTHYNLFDVNGVGSSNTADVTRTDSNPLLWADGMNYFYGIYPQVTSGMSTVSTTSLQVTGLSIPAPSSTSTLPTADMSKAYMYAYASYPEQSSSVALTFKPMFSAFEFDLTKGAGFGSAVVKLNSITISTPSNNLFGTFTATLNISGEYTISSVSSGSKSITFSGLDVTLDASTPTNFSFVALAQDHESVNVTMNLTVDGVSGITRTINLGGASAGGKNYFGVVVPKYIKTASITVDTSNKWKMNTKFVTYGLYKQSGESSYTMSTDPFEILLPTRTNGTAPNSSYPNYYFQFGTVSSLSSVSFNGFSNWAIPSKADFESIISSGSATVNGTNNVRWARVTVDVSESTTYSGKGYSGNNVPGILLFPNSSTVVVSGITNTSGAYSVNKISYVDCKYLYENGCVFLPAAGDYYNGRWYDVGSYGYYWSSTENNSISAYLLYFLDSDVSPLNNNKSAYTPVVLVR